MLRKADGFFIFAPQACDDNAKREGVFVLWVTGVIRPKFQTGTELEFDVVDGRAWTFP